jgi:hypothetical protein
LVAAVGDLACVVGELGLELCPICTQLSRQNTTVVYDPLIEAEIVIVPESVEPSAGEVMVAVV